MKEHFTLRYTSSEDNDTVMELDMSFDNPTNEMLVQRLKDWLRAIGKDNVSVSVKATANANSNEFIYSHMNDLNDN
jgi:hypothetical protein